MVLPAIALIGRPARGQDAATTAYEQDIQDWHERREEGLRRETGWLSVIGLFPLEQGTQTFGSADDADIRFPDGAPKHAGAMR